ncbi:MAG: GTP cyclohydrolase II [Planctomycetes bacterium]|nr:GTP cyclohydrolase II [Planctomycetota bacterium]
MPFSPLPELLDELRAGRMIVLVDDEDRENEGDLVMAGGMVTAEHVNFMLRHARGELCLALDAEICTQLGLELQAVDSGNRFGTAFTVTIDAASGVTTGISAADRARTIVLASAPGTRAADLVRPGHVHPLRSRPGGVMVRSGHTEGSVDLTRLAGLRPAAAIIEILREDGSVARLPELREFAAQHHLKLGSVADIIDWRRRNERFISRASTVRMPTQHGAFQLSVYTSPFDAHSHLALTIGLPIPETDSPALALADPVLCRVHSECLTGDVFGSQRCDCGEQLETAMKLIAAHGRGCVIYMRQEGRGIGLLNKLRAYALQDAGLDTVEANDALGFKPDHRNYGTGAAILHDLGARRLRLLTNNPQKRSALVGYDLEVVERIPLVVPPNADNARYLATKRDKMGHLL